MEEEALLKAKLRLIEFQLENAKKLWQLCCHHPTDVTHELSIIADAINQYCFDIVMATQHSSSQGHQSSKKRRLND